ncbi:MAG: N-acetyltransferase [Phototrophicales bacterium]|nr:MAG: N-acetyltransferase [Phototrophicales bacterium]
MLGNKLLRGNLVYLTANTIDDAEQIAKWFNDLDVSYWSNYHIRLVNTEQKQQRLKQFWENKNFSFAIRTIAEDRYIGIASLDAPDWRNRKTMLGVTIGDKRYWGQGYGSDTVQIMLRYAFLELNLHRVHLGVFSYNTRAIRAYEKIGFVHEGARREALFRDGQYHDMLIMSILRHEWEARYIYQNSQ